MGMIQRSTALKVPKMKSSKMRPNATNSMRPTRAVRLPAFLRLAESEMLPYM